MQVSTYFGLKSSMTSDGPKQHHESFEEPLSINIISGSYGPFILDPARWLTLLTRGLLAILSLSYPTVSRLELFDTDKYMLVSSQCDQNSRGYYLLCSLGRGGHGFSEETLAILTQDERDNI